MASTEMCEGKGENCCFPNPPHPCLLEHYEAYPPSTLTLHLVSFTTLSLPFSLVCLLFQMSLFCPRCYLFSRQSTPFLNLQINGNIPRYIHNILRSFLSMSEYLVGFRPPCYESNPDDFINDIRIPEIILES